MKIEFESREEIQRLASIIQGTIYPAPLIITVEDLLDACGGGEDRLLPWNTDGFHMPVNLGNKEVNKEGRKMGVKAADKKEDNTGVPDNKSVRADGGGQPSYQNRDELIFWAGQLDGYFRLVAAGQSTMRDVAKITRQIEPCLVDLCRIWSRRMARRRLKSKVCRIECVTNGKCGELARRRG